jgi:uncharacterized protein YdaU (DUF1376 family)
MNYYRLHIGDYLRDTAHLSLLEHGVYARLLQVYYTREAPIADADKYRLIGARSADEREAVDAVLTEFFALVDGLWVQDRCNREIADYQSKAERNREVGRLGGRRGGRMVTPGNPDGTQTVSSANPEGTQTVSSANPEGTMTVQSGNPNVTLASSQEPIAIREEKRESASVAAPAPRGRRIPDGFPGDAEIEWCIAERPDLVPAAVSAKFRDYWLGVPGSRGRKVDWPATWRNFVRNERPPVRGSPADVRDAEMARFMGQLTGGLAGRRTEDDPDGPELQRIA